MSIASTGPSCSRSTTGPGDGCELLPVDDGRELLQVEDLDGCELVSIASTGASCSTFRQQGLCPWERLRALAVALRPILAPAIDRVADWPLPAGVMPTPRLVIACALFYLTHAPIRRLRSATWRRCHA